MVGGFKFRRQHIVAGFVVDLYCPAARLAIEVDGPVHESQQHYDEARDAVFDSLGIAVIRVSNDDVLHRLGQVREVILRACSTRVRQDSNDQPRDG
jgi:very-short-patch-repair endonuclease